MAQSTTLQNQIDQLLTRITTENDRESLWVPLAEALQSYCTAQSIEVRSAMPRKTLAASGESQALSFIEFPLVASNRNRGLLRLGFAPPNGLPPAADNVLSRTCAVLALALADEANKWEFERIIQGATHDLRGSFVKVNTFAQLLSKSPGAASQAEALGHISSNVAAIEQLLRDLTAYLPPEIGDRATCSVRDAFETARWNLKRALRENGATLEFEGPDHNVHITEQELADVFQRLIDNAIKFSGEPARVAISAGTNGDGVLISVRDSGPGVEPEYREMIFEPFQRLHGKQYPGHGLGLAISRRRVEAAGGTIWAEAAASHGLCVKLLLPSAG